VNILCDVALLLITPAAEPLVGSWRADHDWAATSGIPAHVTIRFPFLPPAEWEAAREGSGLARFLPLPVTLARLEDRPGALVIVVAPDVGLRRMTEAAGTAWPHLPPHRDNRSDLAYHVTVVRTADASVRAAAWEAIEPHLPLEVQGTELWAADGSPERGAVHTVLTAPSARRQLPERPA